MSKAQSLYLHRSASGAEPRMPRRYDAGIIEVLARLVAFSTSSASW